MTEETRKKAGAGVIRWLIAILVIAAVLFGIVWTYPMLRSDVVMSVYSAQQTSASVMKDCGLDIRIPITNGWYSNMLVFNADGFSAWSGIDAKMTVLYSFGAFDLRTRASTLYDPESEKYSAFYGAYAVQKDGDDFGFNENGSLNTDEVIEAVRYDDTQLVMANFGCKDTVFEVESLEIAPDTACAGSDGWTCIDAALRVSGAAHTYNENKLAYLQYGKPTQRADEDFTETDMAGRIYVKYLPENGCTVMMYCLAPEQVTVEKCDIDALQKAVISALE
jgi:hypothetical protein